MEGANSRGRRIYRQRSKFELQREEKETASYLRFTGGQREQSGNGNSTHR